MCACSWKLVLTVFSSCVCVCVCVCVCECVCVCVCVCVCDCVYACRLVEACFDCVLVICFIMGFVLQF